MPRQTLASSSAAPSDLANQLRKSPTKTPAAPGAAADDDDDENVVRRGSIVDMDQLNRQRVIKKIFYTIFIAEMVINFDSGAVPAVLSSIKKDFILEPWELGLLGGLQYIGLVFMSPFAGMLLQKYPTKVVLACSLSRPLYIYIYIYIYSAFGAVRLVG